MKKRWIQSVIETSKQESPALPFQRGNRKALKAATKALRRA
ncbi:MAG: hypothetical protein RIG84_15580 [Roseovarius sp.]